MATAILLRAWPWTSLWLRLARNKTNTNKAGADFGARERRAVGLHRAGWHGFSAQCTVFLHGAAHFLVYILYYAHTLLRGQKQTVIESRLPHKKQQHAHTTPSSASKHQKEMVNLFFGHHREL